MADVDEFGNATEKGSGNNLSDTLLENEKEQEAIDPENPFFQNEGSDKNYRKKKDYNPFM